MPRSAGRPGPGGVTVCNRTATPGAPSRAAGPSSRRVPFNGWGRPWQAALCQWQAGQASASGRRLKLKAATRSAPRPGPSPGRAGPVARRQCDKSNRVSNQRRVSHDRAQGDECHGRLMVSGGRMCDAPFARSRLTWGSTAAAMRSQDSAPEPEPATATPANRSRNLDHFHRPDLLRVELADSQRGRFIQCLWRWYVVVSMCARARACVRQCVVMYVHLSIYLSIDIMYIRLCL